MSNARAVTMLPATWIPFLWGQALKAPTEPCPYLQAVHMSLHEALKPINRSEVRAMAVSGQQHGLVAVNARCEPVRPAKLWCDVEASKQAKQLSASFGWSMPPAFTAAKLRWLQEEEPETYDRMKYVLLPHDYMNYWLTGMLAMEV